jgi:hypothetical protein
VVVEDDACDVLSIQQIQTMGILAADIKKLTERCVLVGCSRL